MDLTASTVIANNVLLGRTFFGDRVFVTVETSDHEGISQTTHHQPIRHWTRISITGEIFEKGRRSATGGGQIVDTLLMITDYAPGWDKDKVTRLAQIWKDHHLNDMRAGCIHQIVVMMTGNFAGRVDLDATPPCPATGYKYGHAWLVDPEAETQVAIMRLQALFSDRWED